MKLLIVEDDPFKLNQLRREVEMLFAGSEVSAATSLKEAMEALTASTFDLVLLDMAIPSHSRESGSSDIYSQPVGGLDVLMHLSFNNRDEKVVIVTQYPTVEYDRKHVPLGRLRDRLQRDDIDNVVGAVLFGEDGLWKSSLRDLVGTIL